MKKDTLYGIGIGIVIGGLLMSSSRSQNSMTVGPVTTTNTVFTSFSLTGGAALFWGNQFAAITNQDGTYPMPGTVLNAFFGSPGVPHKLDIASINNPQSGTNLFTLTFTAQ